MENDKVFQMQMRIAGLHTISFFGYVLHIGLHAMLAPGMDPKLLEETMNMMNQPASIAMMIFFTVFTLLPALFSYIFKSKNGWQLIAIIGLISLVLNGLHAIMHASQGDFMNGTATFLVQVPAALVAVLWSFKLVKVLKKSE